MNVMTSSQHYFLSLFHLTELLSSPSYTLTFLTECLEAE